MSFWKPLAHVLILNFTLLVSQATAILGQDLPPELGSSIKSLQAAKVYCERVLREVEAGTSVLVPFQVKTVDGKTMLIDEYRTLPKDQQPKVLETERLPVEVKDLQVRFSAAKLSAADQKRIIGDMVADSRANIGAEKKQIAKTEESLGLSPVQIGTSSGKQVTLHGEVVEVTGDKVRIALKSKAEPQVGDPVKISYEIAGTDIKADVAKGKVAKVEPGFANVDITSKTAEIRKGYLAEIVSTTNGNDTKPPQPVAEINLAGEWTITASTQTAFGSEYTGGKPFRLEKAPTAGIFRNPGSSNARIVVAKDELLFINNAGGRGATAKIDVDPKTGAIQRIEWSDGSVFTRETAAVVDLTSELNYLPDDCVAISSVDIAAFMKSKLYQELKSQIKDFEGGMGIINDRNGISLDNFARITSAKSVAGEITIITTLKPIRGVDLQASMKPFGPFEKNHKVAEVKIGKYTCYEESYQFQFDPKDKPGDVIRGRAFCVVEEKMVISGRLEAIKKVLERQRKPVQSPGLAGELKTGLTGGFTLIFEVPALPERERKEMVRDLDKMIPGTGDALAGVQVLTIRGSAADNVTAIATVTCKDKASAESVKNAADAGLALFKLKLGLVKNDPEAPAEIKQQIKTIVDALGTIKLAAQDTQVRAEVSLDPAGVASLLRSAIELTKAKAKKLTSANNLKQIGLGLHVYHDFHKALPAAGFSKNAADKQLLSWRVAILPYMDQKALYDEFKLDEPWDSPHNRKLLARMPKTFAIPGIQAKEGMTHYRALVGPGTVLEPQKGFGRKLLEILDGSSNTIVVVEAAEPIEWTRPDDLAYDPKGPLPKFGVAPGGFHVLFADVTVQFVPSDVPEAVLRPYLTGNNSQQRMPLNGGRQKGSSTGKADGRDAWLYKIDNKDGWIKKGADKKWVETAVNGVQFHFEEVSRTAEFVELFDKRREMTVRLFADHLQWRQGDNPQWARAYDGQWMAR